MRTSGINDVKVKVCGLTNLKDARTAARFGADFLGFVFAESPRRLSLEDALTVWGDLPPGVPRVGVFKDQTTREVGRIIERLPFGYLQFHGKESPAICRSFGLPVIKAVSARDAGSLSGLELHNGVADFFLVDLPKKSGGKKVLSLEIARAALKLKKPVFLAGGFTPENVGDLLKNVHPFAVDVARGVEKSPGKKDPERLHQIIQAVRNA